MEGFVSIELLAEQSLANSLIENGLAEVVLRQSDQKFKSFTKCQIMGRGDNVEEAVDSLMEMVTRNISVKEGRGILQHARTASNSGINKVQALDLSLFRNCDIGKYIPYFNSILSVADLAVDAVGFRILSNQLAEQQDEIHGIAIQLGINSDAQKNEKIAEFENLIMRFNDMSEALEFNEQINLKDLGDLLR